MAEVRTLARYAIRRLNLPKDAEDALTEVHDLIDAAYRDRLAETVEAVTKLTAAVDRMQQTLDLLITNAYPQIRQEVPPVLSIAPPGERPDLATMGAVADPLGLGYTLSQADIARLVDLPQAYVSDLVLAFGLDTDAEFAVVVRQGKRRVVNYRRVAVTRLLELIRDESGQPQTKRGADAWRRARRKLGI